MDYLKIQPIDFYTGLDSFCDESGIPNLNLPRANWEVTFIEKGDHALVATIVTYNSLADLETVIQMGMQEGLTSALESLDNLLLKLKK